MQTFLPYKSFSESAKVLDNKRLGKQRVEAYQILKTLLKGPITDGKKTPWYNHPAVQMWKGQERALCDYGKSMCLEWIKRGFKDSLKDRFTDFWIDCQPKAFYPAWLGDERFHSSHRSNLLRKDPKHYGQFGWEEPADLLYFWPTKEGDYGK